MSQIPAAVVPPVQMAPDDSLCNKCSYSLRGLPVTGRCPECGTPVEHSLRGFMLQYASADYLNKIQSGLSLVLNGILLSIIFGVLGMVVSAATGGGNSAGGMWLQVLIQLLGLIPAIMILLGYWRFSEPDPGFVGRETPGAARQYLRAAVCVQAGAQAVSLLVSLAAVMFVMTGGAPNAAGAGLIAIGILALLAGLANLIAWLVQFFSVMHYMRWMGRRIPDLHLINRSGTYMWLLPLIAVLGLIVLVGPLVALVLYWNLLDRLRKQVRAILATGQPAALPGRLG